MIFEHALITVEQLTAMYRCSIDAEPNKAQKGLLQRTALRAISNKCTSALTELEKASDSDNYPKPGCEISREEKSR
ncbi:hypothetical protein [Vibrio mediterranei]|uniref:Uncharacterized protein n=1 Tax=Vibrio mediterranei TaxID=689 RepID=A0AAN1FKS5_9VIBR|nr:hypothetical protein [Vibrio mediterranei]ASI92470.1 hypothetical protein BSZ05_21975 [Vibrio mediterranei]